MSCGYASVRYQTQKSFKCNGVTPDTQCQSVYSSYLGKVSINVDQYDSKQFFLQKDISVGGRKFNVKVIDARQYPDLNFENQTIPTLLKLESASIDFRTNFLASVLSSISYEYKNRSDNNKTLTRKNIDAILNNIEIEQCRAELTSWCLDKCGVDFEELQAGTLESPLLYEHVYSICCTHNAGVDVMFNNTMFLDFLYTQFAQVGINNSNQLVSVINVPSLDNAFYTSNGYMVFGQGQNAFRNLVAMDVTFHELSHGITAHLNGLRYQGIHGAMNECFSDVMAAAGEFYTYSNNPELKGVSDWDIGEDITVNKNVGRLRDMRNPELGMNPQPSTYKGKYWADDSEGAPNNGGVHTNSGVGNRLFFLVSEKYNDVQKAARVFFECFKGFHSESTYTDLRRALLKLDPTLSDCLETVCLSAKMCKDVEIYIPPSNQYPPARPQNWPPQTPQQWPPPQHPQRWPPQQWPPQQWPPPQHPQRWPPPQHPQQWPPQQWPPQQWIINNGFHNNGLPQNGSHPPQQWPPRPLTIVHPQPQLPMYLN